MKSIHVNEYTSATISKIAAMRQQEETAYHELPTFLVSPTHQQPLQSSIDGDCRKKMAVWCYQAIDYCNCHRETVAYAMSYLDRFLMTTAGVSARRDPMVFQLAGMTALYTAVKIHEPVVWNLKVVVNLSRGAYSFEQIASMERKLLMALGWRLNPPTPMAYLRLFLDLLRGVNDECMQEELLLTAYEMTIPQIELAVTEACFVAIKPSAIAMCAFLNSLESLAIDENLVEYTAFTLSQAAGVDLQNDSNIEIQSFLYNAMRLNVGATPTIMDHKNAHIRKQNLATRSSFEGSPKSATFTV